MSAPRIAARRRPQVIVIDALAAMTWCFEDEASAEGDAVLDCHDVPGGTAPARVRAALKNLDQRLQALQEELHAHA